MRIIRILTNTRGGWQLVKIVRQASQNLGKYKLYKLSRSFYELVRGNPTNDGDPLGWRGRAGCVAPVPASGGWRSNQWRTTSLRQHE